MVRAPRKVQGQSGTVPGNPGAAQWVTLREAARQTRKPRQTLLGMAIEGRITVERRGPYWFVLADERYAAAVADAADDPAPSVAA